MKTVVLGMLAGVLLLGCDPGPDEAQVALQPLGSCGEVVQAIRAMALETMNERIDASIDSLMKRTCYHGNQDDRSYGGVKDQAAPGPSYAPPSGGETIQGGGSAKQASGTNNQVAGVDEADFIKNDKKYIYVVSGQHFRIIDAWPAATAAEIARVKLEGVPRKLFVAGDRAMVYSSLPAPGSGSTYVTRECTYGYNCSFTGDGKPTLITILDIKDRAAPKAVRTLKLSGSYVNARRINGAVFTVISSPGIHFSKLSYRPANYAGACPNPFDKWRMLEGYEALRRQNRKIIMETPIHEFMPAVEDRILGGSKAGSGVQLLAGCKGFFKSGLADGGQFTTLLSFDMVKDSPAAASTIVSQPGAVYASSKALYISVPHEARRGKAWYGSMRKVEQASTVHKFAIDGVTARSRYSGSGVVKGRVLNQFSMDEREGYLRIATTTGRVPSSKVHSTVTVLADKAGALAAVGQLDNLAPKEDIRSVRFAGERGFIVTFKKTDPLFVIDLSKPRAPAVLSELKIPGYSTYMHMMDSQHLLTIGYDANDQGSFAWFTGVMLQIFDVSDPKNPKRTHKEVIGTRGSSSEALTNHLAFNYFGPKDLLALPMTVCEGGSGGGSYGKNMTFSGLMVYDVTTSGGFKLRGKVDHPAGKAATCSNWWTNASSQVKRSIIMDDYVFSVSGSLIKVNHLTTLGADLTSLDIAD